MVNGSCYELTRYIFKIHYIKGCYYKCIKSHFTWLAPKMYDHIIACICKIYMEVGLVIYERWIVVPDCRPKWSYTVVTSMDLGEQELNKFLGIKYFEMWRWCVWTNNSFLFAGHLCDLVGHSAQFEVDSSYRSTYLLKSYKSDLYYNHGWKGNSKIWKQSAQNGCLSEPFDRNVSTLGGLSGWDLGTPWCFPPVTCLMIPIAKIASS